LKSLSHLFADARHNVWVDATCERKTLLGLLRKAQEGSQIRNNVEKVLKTFWRVDTAISAGGVVSLRWKIKSEMALAKVQPGMERRFEAER